MLVCDICHKRRADYYLDVLNNDDGKKTIVVCGEEKCNQKAEEKLRDKLGEDIEIQRTLI